MAQILVSVFLMLSLLFIGKHAAAGELNNCKDRFIGICDAAESIVRNILKYHHGADNSGKRAILLFAPYEHKKPDLIAESFKDELFAKFREKLIGYSDYRVDVTTSYNQNVRNEKRFSSSDYILGIRNWSVSGTDLKITFEVTLNDSSRLDIVVKPITITNLTLDEKDTSSPLLSMEDATTKAAEQFYNFGHDMRALYWNYLNSADHHFLTCLERNFMDDLIRKLQNRYTNLLTNKKLKTKRYKGKLPKLGAGDYAVQGHSQFSSTKTRIHLKLTGPKGDDSWSGSVKRPSMGTPIHKTKYKRYLEALRNRDNKGETDLKLTTSVGENPTISIKEEWGLQASVSKEAWLYCYYFQSDKIVKPIFPSPNHKEKSPLATGRFHLFPTTYIAEPPQGFEVIKCFATGKNLDSELKTHFWDGPNPLWHKTSPHELTIERANRILNFFRDRHASEASIGLTIIRKSKCLAY